MKQAVVCILIATLLVVLSACGSAVREDTTSQSVSDAMQDQTQLHTGVSANSTLGSISTYDGASVEDASVLYRTRDSYQYEEIALRAAKQEYMQTLSIPQSLLVRRYTLWNCSDDGKCVYYEIHIDGSYLVESGERISSGHFCAVGVRKADQSVLDASDLIDDTADRYSVFLSENNSDTLQLEETDPIRAAEKIALQRLKHPDQGKILSSVIVNEQPESIQIEVLCSGINDYRMQIPGVYTVYLARNAGKLYEIAADS
ncbi:MAG: hypothetical protein IJT41_00735 [Clostridia bacterium]|nr:hypothetical protein [Clostridia bacterium]